MLPIRVRTEELCTPPTAGEVVPLLEPGEAVQTIKSYGIGVDCHAHFIQVCVLVQTRDREVRRWEREFSTQWADLVAAREWAIGTIVRHTADPQVTGEAPAFTIESTSTYHLPVIKAFAGVPSVVNPLLTAMSRKKTDRLDARKLAYHAITGLWPPSFVISEEVQTLRVLWKRRVDALRTRTRLSNQINNLLLRFGHTVGATCSVTSQEGRAIVEDLIAGHLPLRPGICPTGLPADIGPVLSLLWHRSFADGECG